MRAYRFSFVLAMVVSLSVSVAANASSVTDANIFTGSNANASSVYSSPTFDASHSTDGTNAQFVFSDNQAFDRLNISGFTTSNVIGTLRFFDTNNGERATPTVKVYHSPTNQTSLSPGDYNLLGTFSLARQATGSGYDFFTNPTSPPELYTSLTGPINYAELTGLAIPSGTQSVLFEFAPITQTANPNGYGPAFSEVQAFVPKVGDNNLLLGKPVAVTSEYGGAFAGANATDGTNERHVFSDANPADRFMAVGGFDSALGLIRIWNPGDRQATSVTILSSLNATGNSLDPANYETTLAVINSALQPNGLGYLDIPVQAALGTQSLLFMFGPGDNAPGASTYEVQAFAPVPVPEPTSLVLFVCGGAAALLMRKRRD